MNDILYVVLNKELRMSAGKAAAQAVHAVVKLEDSMDKFIANYKRSVIVLQAENAEQIRNLQEYLQEAGIYSEYYIDEGFNEVQPYSLTALAVEPFDSDDTEKREIFERFRLFGLYHYGAGEEYKVAHVIEEEERKMIAEKEAAAMAYENMEKSNIYLDAQRALCEIKRTYQWYDGIEAHDNTPRWLNKAIKKLDRINK